MSGVRRALLFSFAERYAMLVISLVSNLIIARLLTPGDIGAYSVSLAVISVAQVLRDFGVANYLIQENDLTDEHIRTALGVTLALGLGLGLAVFAAAPLVARFYGEPQMASLLRVCSINFLLLPFSTVSLALLRRRLAFKELAIVNLIATTVGALVSTSLAWSGLGSISLAIGAVSVSAVTGLSAWVAQNDRRVLLPGLSEWRRLLSFGARSSSVGVVTSVSMDINDLAVGKLMGFEAVALLSRAQGLMSLFHRDLMGAVRNVAFPAFAKAAREQQVLEPMYLASVTNVTVVAWPFYGFVSLYAIETLRLLYGPQWDSAAPLVPIFCLAGAFAATGSLIGTLIIAMGRLDLLTPFELVFQPARAGLVLLAAFSFRQPWACAAALAAALAIHVPMLYWLKARLLPNDWATLRRNFCRSFAVTGLALTIPVGLYFVAGWQRSAPAHWILFSAAIMSCIVAWLLALAICRHPIAADPAFQRLTRGWLRPRDNRVLP